MVDLEYRIGELYVIPSELKCRFSDSDDFDPYDVAHKFVVEALDNVVSIYVAALMRRHTFVAHHFNLEGQIVGGGSFYLNSENQLVLNDFSQDYKAIPKEVAQKLAKLTLPELEKLGVKVKGIAVNPKESSMNSYWRNQGFGSQ